MPCRVDPTPEEIEARNRRYIDNAEKAKRTDKAEDEVKKAQTRGQKDAEQINFLSVQLDYTRDLLWRIWNETEISTPVDSELAEEVSKTLKIQEKHRKADLDRLIKTLSKNPTEKNKQRLRLVLDADVSKPLEPQLGFDPDSL